MRRRGRRGIIVGGITLLLLFGCNNGGEDPQKVFLKSVVSLGSNFLDVFTSFGEMAGGVLGFSDKTKKSEVGDYFKKVKETVEGAKNKLNTMVESMKAENNPNASKTEIAVTDLNKKLDKIIEGASDAMKGADGEGAIGNVAAGGGSDKAGAVGTGVEDLVKGIGKIVEVVLKEGSATAGDDNGPVKDDGTAAGDARSTGTHGDARKLFSTTDAGAKAVAAKAAKDASKAVGAVSGADILQAIKSGSDAAKLAKETTGTSTDAKDATIVGGIALRAMSKDGKFANGNDATPGAEGKAIANVVKGAAISAVTKALDTLTIAIRKTIDEELKKVKEAMNINPETTPVTTETGNVTK